MEMTEREIDPDETAQRSVIEETLEMVTRFRQPGDRSDGESDLRREHRHGMIGQESIPLVDRNLNLMRTTAQGHDRLPVERQIEPQTHITSQTLRHIFHSPKFLLIWPFATTPFETAPRRQTQSSGNKAPGDPLSAEIDEASVLSPGEQQIIQSLPDMGRSDCFDTLRLDDGGSVEKEIETVIF